MSREERINPIRREDYTFCDVCGRKVPLNQIGGQCVSCGRRACTRCTVMINDRIYCKDCAPPPPPPPPPPTSTRGCFIATAAYNTPQAKEIQVLRNFRDRSLLTNRLGQSLTSLYYKTSPTIATKIAKSAIRRKIVRNIINPLVKFLKEQGY